MIEQGIVEQARNTDVIDFLYKHHGFTFSGFSNSYRCQQHPSLAVKNDRRSWFWHSKGIGGYGTIDFLMKTEHKPFAESVEIITGIGPVVARPVLETTQSKKLYLPSKSDDTKRLHDYLCRKRGIDSWIVGELMDGGKIYQDKRGNVVFVSHDGQGEVRSACLRGTFGSFRMDCAGSDKRYGFNMAACVPSKQLYIFESAIDAMSHASLANVEKDDKTAWLRHSRLSLAGTSDIAIPFFLNQHRAVKDLSFCLDNDPAGHDAAEVMVRKYANMGYQTWINLPNGKDYNEDLLASLTAISEKHRYRLQIAHDTDGNIKPITMTTYKYAE